MFFYGTQCIFWLLGTHVVYQLFKTDVSCRFMQQGHNSQVTCRSMRPTSLPHLSLPVPSPLFLSSHLFFLSFFQVKEENQVMSI